MHLIIQPSEQIKIQILNLTWPEDIGTLAVIIVQLTISEQGGVVSEPE